ncbi:MAG: hypothetical protein A2X45_14290 [Lentisphaerae bacterium GWF2_50_93]|nr:MAG: hypothetical protein A2X45_14290 [Lentisphaerae bacterium GWF2_50_93]
MGNPLRDSRSSFSLLMLLLFANVAFFIVQISTERDVATQYGTYRTSDFTESLALDAKDVRHGQIYRLFTYMFLHGSVMHILFNMWGLYMFGSILEQRIGPFRFFNLYFISGLSGAGLWMLSNWNSSIPCVGASGAVSGIIIATAMFYPDMRIMLLIPPIPMKLKTFAFVFLIVELAFEFGVSDGIAHLAHVGGFLGGYLYIRLLYKDEIWDMLSVFKFGKGKSLYSMKSPPPGWSVTDKQVTQAEMDRILDKLSATGINSLTEQEMETLRKAREQMRAERKG